MTEPLSNPPGRWLTTLRYYRDFPQKVQPYLPANVLDIRTEIYTGPSGLYGGLRNLLHRLGLVQMLRRMIGLRVIMTARFFFTYPAEDFQPDTAEQAEELIRGVNVVGYLYSEKGIGQAARNILQTLKTTDFAHGYIPIHIDERDWLEHADIASDFGQERYPINIIHLNADTSAALRDAVSETLLSQHYNIGFWFWELERFPAEWERSFAVYDEIWVATDFVQQAIAAAAPIPVVRIPLPVELTVPEGITRSALSLPEAAFLCLFIFDAHSIFERKNPWGVIDAFRQAFTAQEYQQDVRLVIKVNNLSAYPADAEKLREAMNSVNGILLDVYLTRDETTALLNLCDVYISLHRSEGYGLTIAEAMYLSKPVIATAYSGNMDFMSVDNSYPVPYQLAELAQDYPPYKAGNVWAEPDTATAGHLLRHVYENRAEAELRGQRAATHLRKHYNPVRIGQQIQARLEWILRNRTVAE